MICSRAGCSKPQSSNAANAADGLLIAPLTPHDRRPKGSDILTPVVSLRQNTPGMLSISSFVMTCDIPSTCGTIPRSRGDIPCVSAEGHMSTNASAMMETSAFAACANTANDINATEVFRLNLKIYYLRDTALRHYPPRSTTPCHFEISSTNVQDCFNLHVNRNRVRKQPLAKPYKNLISAVYPARK